MSAIAFYDSGRLLPYRHDLKQKQIEQRNIDAENTRKYIGYAGGAFANMAERTGTIFGGRLGSTDAEGQKYGGGTVGAEYAKAEWQKGMLDDESNRRRVTHKLGLLQENVKYEGLLRKYKAWGNIDPKPAEEAYHKRWDQYQEDSKDTPKIDLIKRYPDLFPKEATRALGKVMAKDENGNFLVEDEEARNALLAEINDYAMYSNWYKYAEENGMYHPEVNAEPRPAVDMLMTYLKEEVGFKGINKNIADKNNIEKQQQAALLKKKRGDITPELLPSEIIKRREANKKEKLKPAGEIVIEGSDGEPDVTINKANPFNLPIVLALSEEQKDKERIEKLKKERASKEVYTAKDFKLGEKEKLERYEGYVPKDERLEPSLPQESIPELDLSIVSNSRVAEEKKIANLAKESIFTSLAKVWPNTDDNGEELTGLEIATEGIGRLTNLLEYKFANNLPMGDLDFTSNADRVRMERITGQDAPILSPKEEINFNLEKKKAELIIKARRNKEKGSGEIEMMVTKIVSKFKEGLAHLESAFPEGIYDAGSELEAIEVAAKKYMEKPPVAEVAKRTTFRSDLRDPSKLNAEQVDDQIYTNLMTHEDALSDGGVVEDRHRTILTGSVDLWNMVGITEGGKRKLNPKKVNGALDALKLGDRKSLTFLGTQQKSAILKYLHATDVDSLLGNVKRTGKKLTPSQKQMRKLLTFTPQQTHDLVMWAYNNNMDTLNTNHGFLDQNVYKALPELEQLLGDMAYRFGGSFMTVDSKGYQKLDDALEVALFSTDGIEKNKAITDMESILFKQGTYKKNNERVDSKGNPRDRFVFLQDRFDRFKERVTGVSVAKRPVPPASKRLSNITLHNPTVTNKKKINLLNPDYVNVDKLKLPAFNLTR